LGSTRSAIVPQGVSGLDRVGHLHARNPPGREPAAGERPPVPPAGEPARQRGAGDAEEQPAAAHLDRGPSPHPRRPWASSSGAPPADRAAHRRRPRTGAGRAAGPGGVAPAVDRSAERRRAGKGDRQGGHQWSSPIQVPARPPWPACPGLTECRHGSIQTRTDVSESSRKFEPDVCFRVGPGVR